MAKKMKKMAVLAALQTARGTAAAVTPASNAMAAHGIEPKAINVNQVERPVLKGYLGADATLPTSPHSEVSFSVELAGSGAAGTAPAFAPLLRMCGFSETLTAANKAEYLPHSDEVEVGTIHVAVDGLLHKMTDCLGSVSFEVSPGAIPMMSFRFIGEYHAPTDTPLPSAANYSAFTDPVPVGRIHTDSLTVFGHSSCVSAFSFDTGAEVEYTDYINCGGSRYKDRAPSGSVTVEAKAAAAVSWPEVVRTGQTGALALVHGKAAGNIVQVDLPKIQIKEHSYTDQGGMVYEQLPFVVLPVVGNDEIKLTFR